MVILFHLELELPMLVLGLEPVLEPVLEPELVLEQLKEAEELRFKQFLQDHHLEYQEPYQVVESQIHPQLLTE